MNQPSVHIVAKWLGYPVIDLPTPSQCRKINNMPPNVPEKVVRVRKPQHEYSPEFVKSYCLKHLQGLKTETFAFIDIRMNVFAKNGDFLKSNNIARSVRTNAVKHGIIEPAGFEQGKPIYRFTADYKND